MKDARVAYERRACSLRKTGVFFRLHARVFKAPCLPAVLGRRRARDYYHYYLSVTFAFSGYLLQVVFQYSILVEYIQSSAVSGVPSAFVC